MATQRPPWLGRLPTMRPPSPAIQIRPPQEPSSQPPTAPPSPPAPTTPAPPPSSPVTKASSSNPTPPIKKTTPPSPLQLPPPQIRPSSEEERQPKIEQKSVLVQEKPNTNSKGKREPPTKDKATIKKLSDSEDLGMRVITIAGENRGALMEITSSSSSSNKHKKDSAYTLANGKSEQDKELKSQPPMSTFLNSNVQGVNNSIVFNSSCHHNHPGIHLSLLTNKHNASHHG